MDWRIQTKATNRTSDRRATQTTIDLPNRCSLSLCRIVLKKMKPSTLHTMNRKYVSFSMESVETRFGRNI